MFVIDAAFWQGIDELVKKLDAHCPAFGDPLQWRIQKIGEEFGEALTEFGLAAGQNPRKNDGIPTLNLTATVDELCDTVVTTLVALRSIPGVEPAEAVTQRLRQKLAQFDKLG